MESGSAESASHVRHSSRSIQPRERSDFSDYHQGMTLGELAQRPRLGEGHGASMVTDPLQPLGGRLVRDQNQSGLGAPGVHPRESLEQHALVVRPSGPRHESGPFPSRSGGQW